MRKTFILITIFAGVVLIPGIACTEKKETKRGEALFKQYCSPCHADGGNSVNPKKTLLKKDREANGVKTASDIIGKMRTPGPGMTKFDDKTIPDMDANEIAEYILTTFK